MKFELLPLISATDVVEEKLMKQLDTMAKAAQNKHKSKEMLESGVRLSTR
jgi:hypothetical protein